MDRNKRGSEANGWLEWIPESGYEVVGGVLSAKRYTGGRIQVLDLIVRSNEDRFPVSRVGTVIWLILLIVLIRSEVTDHHIAAVTR
jgi:hypothetical protein